MKTQMQTFTHSNFEMNLLPLGNEWFDRFARGYVVT